MRIPKVKFHKFTVVPHSGWKWLFKIKTRHSAEQISTLQLTKYMYWREFKLPNEEGTLPEKSLPSRYKYKRLVRAPTVVGMGP